MTTRSGRRGLLRRAQVQRGTLPFTLASYSGGSLPPASLWTGAHVFVTDDVGGPVEAFSDGVNWRRVTDRAIIAPVVTAAMYGVGVATGEFEGRAGAYLVAAGVAVGTLASASFAGGALSGAGAAVGTLGTPPKVEGALSGAGAATGTLSVSAHASAALSAAGTGAGVCTMVGVAA